MDGFILNLVGCILIESLSGLIMPEGKIKGFVMSILSFFTFYSVVIYLCEFVKSFA